MRAGRGAGAFLRHALLPRDALRSARGLPRCARARRRPSVRGGQGQSGRAEPRRQRHGRHEAKASAGGQRAPGRGGGRRSTGRSRTRCRRAPGAARLLVLRLPQYRGALPALRRGAVRGAPAAGRDRAGSCSVRAGCRPRVWLRSARCRACPRFCLLSAFRRFVPMGMRVFGMRLRCGSGEQSGAELLPSERQPAVPPHGSALPDAAQVGSVRAGRRCPRDGAGGETLLGAPRASAALLSVPAGPLTPAGRLGGSALSLLLRFAWNGPHCRRGFRSSRVKRLPVGYPGTELTAHWSPS